MILRKLIVLGVLPMAWAQDKSALTQFVMDAGETGGHYSMGANAIDAENISLRDLLAFSHGIPPTQILGPGWLNERYHVTAQAEENDESHFHEALQSAISAKLHLKETRSTKQLQVIVLKATAPERARAREGSGPTSMSGADNTLVAKNVPIAQFVPFLTRTLGHPVIDETSLQGGYSVQLEWNAGDLKSLARAFREQLGLEWTEQRREVPVVIVDRQ
jgi:uncharacterized protein (TIGR03435 family)